MTTCTCPRGESNIYAAHHRTHCETSTATDTARFVVNQLGNCYFAVRDTVTGLDVQTMTSRYAANDAADRHNAQAGAPLDNIIDRMDVAVRASAGVSGPGCNAHRIPDQRGPRAEALPVPSCEDGARYGVWDDFDGGFTYVEDCAMDAANWAAKEIDRIVGEMTVVKICPDHEEQRADSCEHC